MDSYIKTIKYIFEKNKIKNTDENLNEFFNNGISFPQFVAILFGLDQIPGIVKPNNIFQISNNNRKALAFIGQKNQFFSSYTLDFKNEKNQVSLIQLILNKIYFNTNKTSFLKKCNDYIQPYGLTISNFSEFLLGTGYMKLLNVYTDGSISTEIESSNNNQLLEKLINKFNSLNIPAIIDKSSFLPTNHDILQYQALIIMEQKKSLQNIVQEVNTNNQNDKTISEDKNEHSLKSSFIENNGSSNVNITKEPSVELNKEKYNDNTISKDKQEKKIKLEEINNSNISLSGNTFKSSEILFLPKISYLNIVNHIIETNNMKGIKFISDFQKGEILPKLIETIFKEKIPDIIDNPLDYDQVMNNMNTLFFINKKDPSFNPRNFNLSVENDVINLIRILLKKYILKDELIDQMKKECNEILQKYNKTITNFNTDWDNGINLVALLNFLSNGYVSFPPPSNLEINLLKSLFVKANSIPVIEKDAIFGNPDELVILYQLKLILDEIKTRKIKLSKLSTPEKADSIQPNQSSSKIEITKPIQNSKKAEITQPIQNSKKAEITQPIQNSKKAEITPSTQDQKPPNKQINIKNAKMIYEYQYTYVKDSCPILRIMNAIGANINLHYNKLEDIISGMTLHHLVKYLMNVPTIPGIKEVKQFEKLNVNSVLNFLRDNNNVFKYSTFDFNDSKKKNDNIIWFATVLLKQFFLKDSKTKMIQKASEMAGEKIFLRNIKEVFLYGNFFYKILGDKNLQKKNYYDEQSLLSHFKNAGVPFVLDNESLININDDYICFQLQLIFNYCVLGNEQSNVDDITSQNESSIKNPIGNQNENSKKDLIESTIRAFNESLIENPIVNHSENSTKIPTGNLNDGSIRSSNGNPNQNASPGQLKNNEKDKKILNTPTAIKYTEIKHIENKDDYFNQVDIKLKKALEKVIDVIDKMPDDYLASSDTNSIKSENKCEVNWLFKYKSNKWEFNDQAIKSIKKNYKLVENDIVHFVLFLPCNSSNTDINKDLMYDLVKKVSGSNEIKGSITNDVCVDIGFCGKIDDIQNRLGLKYIKRKNEYLAFIQIRYPLTFKDSTVIYNMQAALFLQASYMISFYPKYEINNLFNLINKSILKVIQTPVFDNKCIGISQVLSYWPKELDKSFIKKIKHPNLLNQIDISLNGDKELFKELRSCCDKIELNIQWINPNDFDTFKNIIGNAINFCQRNVKTTNQIDYIHLIFDLFKNINSEIGFQNMITKAYDLFLSIQPKPIFNINFTENIQEKILFTSLNFREFTSFNNTEISSLYIIYFSFSNFEDVKYITQIFPQAHIFNSYVTQKNGYDIIIKYCGNINCLIDDYDLKTKVKKKNARSTLAFIYIDNFQIDKNSNKTDDFLLLESIIASKCDAIITIANKQPSDIQIKYANKLKNSLNIFNLINRTSKQDSFESKYYYVINDSSMNKDEHDIKGFPDNITKISLDIKDLQSCNSFLAKLLTELPDIGKQKKKFYYANIDSDIIKNFAFHINLFQDFNITTPKNNDNKNNTNNNLDNNNNNDDVTYSSPMAELAARLRKRKTYNESNTNNNNNNNDDEDDDLCYTDLNHDIAKNDTNKNNDIIINIQLLDETINRLAKFIINLNFDLVSLSNIDSFFMPIFIKLREYNAFTLYLIKIKNGVTKKYVDYITSDFIGKVLENNISYGVHMKELKEYIQNSIFYIKKEFVEQLKDQLENNIKDDIFQQAHQYCIETKKSLEFRYLITNRIFELIKQSNSIERCREEIDQIFNDRHKRNENIQLNKNQIAQDSLKYVLTVRESLKEMTVEIACNEDLEKEIPQDF